MKKPNNFQKISHKKLLFDSDKYMYVLQTDVPIEAADDCTHIFIHPVEMYPNELTGSKSTRRILDGSILLKSNLPTTVDTVSGYEFSLPESFCKIGCVNWQQSHVLTVAINWRINSVTPYLTKIGDGVADSGLSLLAPFHFSETNCSTMEKFVNMVLHTALIRSKQFIDRLVDTREMNEIDIYESVPF